MNHETQKHTKRIESHQSRIRNPWPFEPVKVNFCFLRGPLRWLTAGKNANVSSLLNFRIRLFLKSAVSIKRHDNKFNFNTIFIKIQTLHKVLIKCLQRAKTPATWRFELSTFWRNGVKRKSEAWNCLQHSVTKLPNFTSYNVAVYMYMYFKT